MATWKGGSGVFAGIYSSTSPSKIANYSLVSLYPILLASIWVPTVSIQPQISLQFVSFAASSANSIYPVIYNILENILPQYTVFDPWYTTFAGAFVFAVYLYAKSQNSASPITPELLNNSTEKMFTTVFAAMFTDQLFQPADSPHKWQGELS